MVRLSKKTVGFLIAGLLLWTGQAKAQLMDNYKDDAKAECIEGNCKNGEGKLKITPLPKYEKDKYHVYIGTFSKKKLNGKGKIEIYKPSWGSSKLDVVTFAATFNKGEIVTTDSFFVKGNDYSFSGFATNEKVNPNYSVNLMGDISYTVTNRLSVHHFSGKSELSASQYLTEGAGKSTLGNGISIDGRGLDGFIRLTCGIISFAIRKNDGTFVLKDTLPDKTVREGPYTFAGDCKRNGTFRLYLPDGSIKEVKYKDDQIEEERVVGTEEIQEQARKKKEAEDAAWKKSLEKMRPSTPSQQQTSRPLNNEEIRAQLRQKIDASKAARAQKELESRGLADSPPYTSCVIFILQKTSASGFGSVSKYQSAVLVQVEDKTQNASDAAIRQEAERTMRSQVNLNGYQIVKTVVDNSLCTKSRKDLQKMNISFDDMRTEYTTIR